MATMLIVEDAPSKLKLAELILRHAGHRTPVAGGDAYLPKPDGRAQLVEAAEKLPGTARQGKR